MQSFGTVIKRARKARGWTLDYVASRTRSHKGYVSGMESGAVNPPSAKLILRLASLFQLNEKDLLLRAEIEKAPKVIRAELKRRVFGEARGRGLMARRRAAQQRKRAEEQLKRAWQLAQEAFGMVASL